jgi:hypothetical protein
MSDSTAKIEMTFKKSTKGTHVYESNDTEACITQLYIKKHGLPAVPPVFITITLEAKVQ